MTVRSRFTRVAGSGITFQAGSAAIDSATIMSALVFQLTGNPVVVGAVTAILRFGWLFPQLIVGFLAQRGGSSMHYYMVGAFGRASCMAIMALVLYFGAGWSAFSLSLLVMTIWTAYAFISGIVAVPYNDIVARSVPSELRSRLLATRFFGGGILALGVAWIADRMVSSFAFPISYAAIIAMASILMYVSSIVFVTMGEPDTVAQTTRKPSFFQYLKDGVRVFQSVLRFRRFVYAQWCGGAVLMAMPFYVVQADASGIDFQAVAILLGAQTIGALVSNPLWGWWGDRYGKANLLKGISIGRILPPALVVVLTLNQSLSPAHLFYAFVVIFFILGALSNGLTIAVIGFLMEISPDNLRPAYSGYFNAITAPAFLLPLLAGIIAAIFGLMTVFAISLAAAVFQTLFLMRMDG